MLGLGNTVWFDPAQVLSLGPKMLGETAGPAERFIGDASRAFQGVPERLGRLLTRQDASGLLEDIAQVANANNGPALVLVLAIIGLPIEIGTRRENAVPPDPGNGRDLFTDVVL